MKITVSRLRPYANIKILLLIGFVTHILSTVTVFIIGRSGKIPEVISESGVLWKDAVLYMERCSFWKQRIYEGDFSVFFSRPEQLHVKIYTIFYTLLSPILGENILCFEPLNVTLFLLILYFIYKIGENCFDQKTGLLAALIINFSPTFLLHSTQPLRDSFFIALFLIIINFQILLLKNEFPIRKFLTYLLICYVLFVAVLFVRDSIFPVYAAIVLLTLSGVIFKSRQNFRMHFQKIVFIFCFAGAVIIIPLIFTALLPAKVVYGEMELNKFRNVRVELEKKGLSGFMVRINATRQDFILQQGNGGSVIDGELVLGSVGELIMYTPRAVMIGFFAPFPDMWFAEGKSFGKTGRLIAGGETLVIYFLSVCSILTLYYFRKSIETWLLFLVIISGIVPLGFMVTNVGALYRLRYAFWFLLIIIGAQGFLIALKFLANGRDQDLILKNTHK